MSAGTRSLSAVAGRRYKPSHVLPTFPGRRELGVGQARTLKEELIGADWIRRQEIVGAGCAGDVILINAVAADPDRANENTVAIKRETAGENRDSVRRIARP